MSEQKQEKKEKGRRVRELYHKMTPDILSILIVIIFGAVGAVVAVHQGIISADAIAKYGMWAIIGMIALFMFATGTRTKWDDILVSYLLLLSLGGFGATYLINHGYVKEGYIILGGLGLLFLLLLALYSKTGYKRVRRLE